MKSSLKLLIGYIIVLYSVVCSAAPKDELVIAINGEFDTLHPLVNSMTISQYVQYTANRPMVKLTIEGKPVPVLVKSIPTFENKLLSYTEGKKGIRAQFEFLPEAVWGDGVPVTCRDLKLSWEVGREPTVSTPDKQIFQVISAIEIDAANAKKCTVVYSEPKWNFYLELPRLIPDHLERKVFEQFKNQALGYDRNSFYVKEVSNPGLYNGPYRVTEFKFGSHVSLVPNERFFGKKPHFKKLIFKFILNSATLESQLLSGAVDLASSAGFGFDQALKFEKKIKAQKLPFVSVVVPATIYSKIDFNMQTESLRDERVRQALAYALNRKEMVQALFENRQPIAQHFSTPLDDFYTQDPKEVSLYDYNPKRAEKLLEEAGWKRGAGGIRVRDGKRLELTITGGADNKLTEMIQAFIKAQWQKVGVQLNIKNFPSRVLFGEILRQRKFELGLSSIVSFPNDGQRTLFHSSQIPSLQNSWSGMNRTGWSNPKVDQALDQFIAEFDQKKRVRLMREVLKEYTRELPSLPLYYRSNTSVYPKGLKNYRISPHSFYEFLEVENWRF